MKNELSKRSDIKEEYKWAMEDLYRSDKDWEADYQLLSEKVTEIRKYKGRLAAGSEILLEALRTSDEICMLQEKVYVYANQKLHEDTGNAVYQDLTGKAARVTTQLMMEAAFMTPEILQLPEDKIMAFLQENKELHVYKQYLMNILREKAHTLSDKEEELLAAAGEVSQGAGDIFTMFNNADIAFPGAQDSEGKVHDLTHGNYISYLQSQDRTLRENAFKNMHNRYKEFENMLAATFYANIKQEQFYAKARKYRSTLDAALSGSNVPEAVYDQLIEAVNKKLPVFHRYVRLRKERMGLDKLHMYDLHVPMFRDAEKKISFEEAKKITLDGLKPLGEEYVSLLKEGYENRWIDIYENQGKKSGAYSWGAYGTHPYVLLNYQENMNNVFTLAHEMGHALHSYYSDEAQPYVYAGYKIFVAEVASTCNESLLIHYLIEQAADLKEKAYLINYFLEQFRGTVFRQTMFAEFEKITHSMAENGETLTAQVLSEIYYNLNKKYFGEELTIDEEIAVEWARIPHFYRSFYVYQYATGFSAAVAISDRILTEGQPAVAAYKEFLKGGSSDYPIELLKKAGVDMTQKETVESALSVFEKYLNKLEKILPEV